MKAVARESGTLWLLRIRKALWARFLILIIVAVKTPTPAEALAADSEWVHVTEDDLGIKIETDKLEAYRLP